MTWWTATSVSVTNGQKIVSVATGDDVKIAQEAGGLVIGNNPPVEIKRTFLDGTGLPKIELVLNWPYATQSSQPAVAFPTDGDLAEATRILRSVGSDAVTFAEALAQVLGSTANTVTVATETSGDLTVVPYGKLTADVQALLNQFGDFGVPLYATATKNAARTALGLKPQVTAAATLDLDFTKGDYTVYESAALSFQKKTLAEAVTTTRASSASVNTPFGIQTVGNNIARIEYDPVTGEPLGLLCEEQRTNLLLRSQEYGVAPWSTNNLRGTVTNNSGISPEGLNSASLWVENTDTGGRSFLQGVSVTSGVTYTYSVYVKQASGVRHFSFVSESTANTGVIAVVVNLNTLQLFQSGGTNRVASIQQYPDGWIRLNVTFTAIGTGTTGIRFGMHRQATTTNDAFTSYTGDGTSGVYIWGAQLEAGSFPTSYIKTEASQVTRSSDVSVSRPWTPLSEYTLLFDFDNRFGDTVVIGGVGHSFDDTVYMAGSNWSVRSGGQAISSIANGITLGRNRIALRVKQGDYKTFRNGIQVASSTSSLPVSLLPTRYKLLGSPWETTSSAANIATGTIMRQAMVFPRALSDAELQQLTAL